jgi:FkbM family methyltransferase
MTFDGEDWIHEAGKKSLVYHSNQLDPGVFAGMNVPLFTWAYLPKLGDMVFDLGAGIGTEIEFYSTQVGPTGKVIAIEADPVCFRRLTKLVKVLDLKNVICLNLVVSDVNGTAWISQGREDGLGNFISDTHIEGGKEIAIRKFSDLLNDLSISKIDYMKMNIEGSETSAIRGLGSYIHNVRNMCVSCHDFLPDPQMHTFDQVSRQLINSGFRVEKHPTNPISVWETWYLYGTNQLDDHKDLDLKVVNQRDIAIAERDIAIAERDIAVSERDIAVSEHDIAVSERDIAVSERDIAVSERDNVLKSTTWKIFMPYRKIKKFINAG